MELYLCSLLIYICCVFIKLKTFNFGICASYPLEDPFKWSPVCSYCYMSMLARPWFCYVILFLCLSWWILINKRHSLVTEQHRPFQGCRLLRTSWSMGEVFYLASWYWECSEIGRIPEQINIKLVPSNFRGSTLFLCFFNDICQMMPCNWCRLTQHIFILKPNIYLLIVVVIVC